MLTQYDRIIQKFGGQAGFVRATKFPQSRVSYWSRTGLIPQKHHETIIAVAEALSDVSVTYADFSPPTDRAAVAAAETQAA